MKKVILGILVLMFLMGCTSFKESEFTKHDSQWASWEHMKFSIWGYTNPTEETLQKSKAEGWWGSEIPYVPAK